jgi:DNA polymerase-3 subunit beta
MKLKVKASDLLAALKVAHRVVERKNTIPILANVALAASGNSLVVKSTDMDILAASTVTDVAVTKEGSTTVAAHILCDFVGKLPSDGDVSVEISDKPTLKISRGRSRLNLHTLPIDDFPSLDLAGFTHEFKITGATLIRLMERAQFAISTEETRYYLNGVYMHRLGDKLLAVATDGHRLAKIEADAPDGTQGMPGVIVPRKTVGQLIRLAAGIETVAIALSDKRIKFDFGATTLASKLIDGTFPDYNRVVPVGNSNIATVNRREAIDAVSRVSIVSSERGRAVKCSFDGKGRLEMSVSNPDAGNSEESFEVAFEGNPIDVGFNSRYVQDIVNQIEGETFTMAMADPGSPTLFSGPSDPSSTYVCMPMRV